MKYDHTERARTLTVGAAEFKAKCLDILQRLAARDLEHVTVTRHGRPVAELYPPRSMRDEVESLFCFMRGSVSNLRNVDLTDPVIDIDGWQPDIDP